MINLKPGNMKKLISPTAHAVMDYLVGGIFMMVPSTLGLNHRAVSGYKKLGTGIIALNALTDTPVALKKIVTLSVHKANDAALLNGFMLATFSDEVKNDRRTLAFHVGMLALLSMQYAMTNYEHSLRN